MKILLLFLAAVTAVTASAEKSKTVATDIQAADFCRAARKLSAEICMNNTEECTIKNEAQYEEALKQLKQAPLSGQTINATEIGTLLKEKPTKETVSNLLSKLGGNNTCEVGTYYRLASSIGRYQVKAPKKLDGTKAIVKNWLQKDMATEYPTLLSMLVRTKIASQYVSAGLVKISDDGQKELQQIMASLDQEKQKYAITKEDGTDTSSKWDAKTWQSKIKEEVTETKKYAVLWLKWVEGNWK